ncbi:FAD-dependent oxidoreductase [Halorubrum sp. CBA1229]|uniref:FAD-dependent oxidoreductase n=1 Tax=Halorubrum sp. CBA1229 TaxID=1853699 RepID=UPI0015943605|nr:FAD-dependent oxidoreductase [Halorubrum sp. CBA1229]QKY18738.1 FAD-dependent oxidoreductase [Halorubrum sp. CBA1229]
MTAPVVVVGGDAAGMSAASKLNRDAPDREVIVFERGEWVSYGACGLPYYVKGAVETLEDLVAVTPEEFIEERGIDLRTNHEVTAIDREARTVTVDGPDGEFEQSYSDLLVATGARAVEPPLDGMDTKGVFTLHSMGAGADIRQALGVETPAVDSRKAATEYADAKSPESVGIIGGGYVGIEMAEAFAEHGLDVHLFEMLPHTLQPFGAETAATVENHLREKGVNLHLDTAIDGIRGDERVSAITAGDAAVPVDLALVGVGVAPNTELAADAGIELGDTGAIATDEYGRTNDDHIYAAGDCAEATHVVTGKPDHVPLALTANRSGRAIGQTLAGAPTPVGDIAGTAAVKAFDLEVARTGLVDEERGRAAGFDPVSVTITAPSRAHYYPGGSKIEITMLGDRESGRVLGASMVGREGVAKRIDTVATALHTELTAHQLASLDLAYAPPFSPVWDPVLTVAKVLESKLN